MPLRVRGVQGAVEIVETVSVVVERFGSPAETRCFLRSIDARLTRMDQEQATGGSPGPQPVETPGLPMVRDQRPDPVETVRAAIRDLNEQPECCTCGRQFELTPNHLDQCARCAREFG